MAKRTWSNQFTINEDSPLTVPSWLLREPWTDVSWGNEVCPRFVNSDLELATWVDYDNPEDRELNSLDGHGDWKKYTIIKLLSVEEDVLEDKELFSTNDEEELKTYLTKYTIELKCYTARESVQALLDLSLSDEAVELVRGMLDDLATILAMTER